MRVITSVQLVGHCCWSTVGLHLTCHGIVQIQVLYKHLAPFQKDREKSQCMSCRWFHLPFHLFSFCCFLSCYVSCILCCSFLKRQYILVGFKGAVNTGPSTFCADSEPTDLIQHRSNPQSWPVSQRLTCWCLKPQVMLQSAPAHLQVQVRADPCRLVRSGREDRIWHGSPPMIP